jgi:hypothetical protein
VSPLSHKWPAISLALEWLQRVGSSHCHRYLNNFRC